MILQAATFIALLVNEVSPNPIVVQCVQPPAVDPGLKQWIPTAVSLVSIAVGVWIARWSFSVTSERDHKRWILDQKKVEWSELLKALYEVSKDYIPPYKDEETAKELLENVQHIQRRLNNISAQFTFIARSLLLLDLKVGEFIQFSNELSSEIEYILFNSKNKAAKLKDSYFRFWIGFQDLMKTTREAAERDLGFAVKVTKGKMIVTRETE